MTTILNAVRGTTDLHGSLYLHTVQLIAVSQVCMQIHTLCCATKRAGRQSLLNKIWHACLRDKCYELSIKSMG